MNGLRKLALSALVLGLSGLGAGAASWSAFSSSTSNPGDSFAAGTVAIGDNDSGKAVLTLSNAMPGDTTSGCIKVTYSGSLAAAVKLYGSVSGTLGQYLTLKVTRGSDSSASFPACTGFSADSRDYIGQGAGVVYSGALSSYPSSYSGGIEDPESATGATESWTSSEDHSYKFEVTLQNNAAAAGQSASASFSWEARNQ